VTEPNLGPDSVNTCQDSSASYTSTSMFISPPRNKDQISMLGRIFSF